MKDAINFVALTSCFALVVAIYVLLILWGTDSHGSARMIAALQKQAVEYGCAARDVAGTFYWKQP